MIKKNYKKESGQLQHCTFCIDNSQAGSPQVCKSASITSEEIISKTHPFANREAAVLHQQKNMPDFTPVRYEQEGKAWVVTNWTGREGKTFPVTTNVNYLVIVRVRLWCISSILPLVRRHSLSNDVGKVFLVHIRADVLKAEMAVSVFCCRAGALLHANNWPLPASYCCVTFHLKSLKYPFMVCPAPETQRACSHWEIVPSQHPFSLSKLKTNTTYFQLQR